MSMTFAVLGSLAVALVSLAPTHSTTNLDAARVAIDDAASTAPAAAEPSDLHFRFTPGVWLARLGGTSKFGDLPGADDLSLETDFDLDNLEPSPNFELAVTKGSKWQIDLSVFDFSTDDSGTLGFGGAFGDVAFAPGDDYTASLDITSVALSVSYWQWNLIDSTSRGGPVDLEMAWGAGVRWLSVEQGLSLPGTGVADQGDGEWLIPELIFQVDFDYRLPDSFPVLHAYQVMALASIGPAIGGDGGAVVTLRAGMRFWINQAFSLDFGYRLLEAGVESEEYELNGGLQGLFLSGTLRF